MLKNRLKIIVILIIAVFIIGLIGSCLYENRDSFINGITNKNQVFQVQETDSISGNNSIDTSKWDTNKVNIVYDKDNVPVPVPKGYVASSVENGITPIGQEILEENRVNTGFVIYELTAEEIENGTEVSITKDNFWEESQKRNQWVWVPVPDSSRIYERDASTGKVMSKLYSFAEIGREANSNHEPSVIELPYFADNEKILATDNMQGFTKEKLLQELETELEETIESIEKYGGFYIGRYETGNLRTGVWPNFSYEKNIIVKRMNKDLKSQTWYLLYNNAKNIQLNENVKSNMMWGCLWDETLQWLVDSGSKSYEEINNSVGWGNYKDSIFEYITVEGKLDTKKDKTEAIVPTGSSEFNKANNIYDLAGNISEITMEGYDDGGSRFFRGGGNAPIETNFSVSSRYSLNPLSHHDGRRRACISLY